MPMYMTLFTFKGETLKAYLKKPSDRSAAVDKAAKSVGGRLEAYYWMFGAHDGFAILEMPDSATAARFVITVSASGAFAHLETHELFSSDDVLRLMRGTEAVEYAAPGQSLDFLQSQMP